MLFAVSFRLIFSNAVSRDDSNIKKLLQQSEIIYIFKQLR